MMTQAGDSFLNDTDRGLFFMMTQQVGLFLAKINIIKRKTDNIRPTFGFLRVLVNNELFSLRLDSSQLLLTILR